MQSFGSNWNKNKFTKASVVTLENVRVCRQKKVMLF